MTLGASGAISGLANIAPDLMQPPVDGIEEPRVNAMVELVLPYAVTAAVKALVGHRRNDPVAWSRMRAPLARSVRSRRAVKLFAAVDAHPRQAQPPGSASASSLALGGNEQ